MLRSNGVVLKNPVMPATASIGTTVRYSLMTVMNEAALEIVAHNVRSARANSGLSLDALAGRAEISKGALVALEGAGGNPNLTTLVRLADALGRSVSSLMEEDAGEESAVIVDADDVAPLWNGPSGGTARLLLTGHGLYSDSLRQGW